MPYVPIFPKGRVTTLWETIVQQLQDDAIVAPRVKTWRAFSGRREDVEPVTVDMLPAIRITPAVGIFSWTDETRLVGPFLLNVEFAVPGTDVRELMNMWECIQRALTFNTINYQTYQPLGVVEWRFTTPGIEPTLIGENQGLGAKSVMTITLNIDA